MAGDSVKVLDAEAVVAQRYRVVRCIKSGGMGAVYEVSDLRTKRRLALKTVRPGVVPSASVLARFEQEASITASVDSEHIVKVEDAGVDAETQTAFLTMELLEGHDLDAVLKQEGPLAPARVAGLLNQVANALAAVHDGGIVHRDIKPENLFLTRRDTGEELVKILDFGVAKLIDVDRKTTAFVGTPLYMPPEQIRGEHPDPRADTYALAQVAFALLTGHAYLEPGNVREPTTRRAARYGVQLPTAFDAWFERATAYDVDVRFAAADELVAELATALQVDLPALRKRASRPLALTRESLASSGVRTAAPSHDPSRAGSLPLGDSMGGVSSAGEHTLRSNRTRLAVAVAAGVLTAVTIRNATQQRPTVAVAPKRSMAAAVLPVAASDPVAVPPTAPPSAAPAESRTIPARSEVSEPLSSASGRAPAAPSKLEARHRKAARAPDPAAPSDADDLFSRH